MAFYLLKRIEHNADKDQQGRTAEELCKLLLHAKDTGKCGHNGNEGDEERAGQRDVRHHVIQIVCGGFAGLHTRDKSVIALHVFCHLNGVQGNGGVEISESDNKDNKHEVVKHACVIQKLGHPNCRHRSAMLSHWLYA